MFDFEAPLFWYKLIFTAELLVAEGLVTFSLRKRKNFFLRVVLSVVGVFLFSFLYPTFFYNAAYTSVLFFMIFGVSLLVFKICYDEPWVNLIFCGLIAYTTQHIAYLSCSYIISVTGISQFGQNMYSGTYVAGDFNPLSLVIYFIVYALIYWAVWAFACNPIRKQKDLRLNNLSLLFIVAVVVIVDIVLNAIVTYSTEDYSIVISTVIYILSLISCGLAFGIQFAMIGKKQLEDDLKAVHSLWQQDKKLYELSRENIELINIKCHDLKYQIRALKNSDGIIDKDALTDIENVVDIYDSVVKTGNDVLDVVLSEKSLHCEKHKIKLNCIVDGEKLSFISPADLYSLFGNAIQNAIDAVGKISDTEKRLINLKVISIGNMISIHLENDCMDPETIVFAGGLPQTTKGDSAYHGFGMKSIKHIVEKLSGGLNAQVVDGKFVLDILLPILSE